ncbi:MAG TPA: hypothetical protein VIJ27_00525 [Mucilaginibacter sp.]
MENIDSRLTKALRQSKLKMPYADFEAQVMYKVNKEVVRKSILRNIKYAFIFFSIFLLLGLFINSQVYFQKITIKGISHQLLILIFQAVFVLCFVMQIDYMLGIIKDETANIFDS